MKRILLSLIVIAVVFFITACNGRKSAVDFNNKLIETQNNITSTYNQFVEKVLPADNVDSTELVMLCDSLLTNIQKNIDDVKVIEAPQDGEYFKEAAVITFQKYKQMIEKKIEANNLQETDSIHIQNKLIGEFNMLRRQADSLESILTKAQKEFAEVNKLQVKQAEN